MPYRAKLFLCAFLNFLVKGCLGNDKVTAAENVTSLRKALLRNYDPYLRPRKNQIDPVVINASFFVLRFNDINEKEETVTLLGSLMILWNDEFLVWDKQQYSNISSIELKTNDIWWPTISLGNPVGDFETFENPYKIFRVSSSGDIVWFPGGLYSVVCELNLKKYPFDTQNCDFIFSVLGYPPDDIIINAVSSDLQVRGTTEWDVVAGRVSSMPYGKTGLIASFTLQRKPFFVVLTVLLPLCLLSVMNVFVFLIPVESGEKISFAITTFLAYSIYLSAIGSSLPAKDNVHMAVYIEILMVLSVVIMVLVIVQTRLFFYYGDHNLPCFAGKVGVDKTIDRPNSGDENKMSPAENSKPLKRTWANSMVLMDKIFFFSFTCVLGSVSIYYFDLMMLKS
ncbi:neuronal acetylcholine receptor subunit alpha-3-like [Saccostrea echinata]|uniref:neuronal acetylcholine receptor subunit alpha-3-like n=1 Tax=Saccostrea echinata TaxID=191078 RepID=UPI002A820C74|nr:neuronal acetylcholine receptor subunit alpha-3-like [Saccostrea echinata]